MSAFPGEEAARYQTDPAEQAQALQIPAEQAQALPTAEQALAVPIAADQAYPPPPPSYGQQPVVYQQVQAHSPALGVIASFFIPGLGSMLNEQVGKGVAILACYLVSILLCFFLIGIVLAPACWIWGMVAANNDAHKWNRAHGIIS